MECILTDLQTQNSKTLKLESSPNATWHMAVNHGPDGYQNPRLDWTNYSLTIENILLAQRLLLTWWRPYIVDGKATISNTAYRQSDTLKRILMIIDEIAPSAAVAQLNESDWQRVCHLYLHRQWSADLDPSTKKRFLTATQKPLAKQVFERFISVMKMWFDSYQEGEVNDGPEVLLTTTMLLPTIKAGFTSEGYDFDRWTKGGSFGTVPFVVAHLLLSDALKVVNSEPTRYLCAYFAFLREYNLHELQSSFWKDSTKSQLGQYRHSGNITVLQQTTEANVSGSMANLCKVSFAAPLHKIFLSIHSESGSNESFVFPWKNYTELLIEFNRVQAAIYIIFLSVMGKRGPSEVRTLRGVDITRNDPETRKDAEFNPSIWKTNKGLRQAQGVTNFIDDAMACILSLGYYEKTGSELPLFHALPTLTAPLKTPETISIDRAHDRLRNYYDEFCERIDGSVDFEVKTIHEKITSHQFRHSFAEFALRRFDGNVSELIRQHFCHHHNHWFTKKYTEDKLDGDQIVDINREYIRELVPSIIRDSVDFPDYVGAVALYIKKKLGESIRSASPEDVESILDEFYERIIKLTPHEYGWCFLLEEGQSSAKCRDVNGKPDPSNTSSDKCNGCPNFCASRKSHAESQKMIFFNHMDFCQQEIWKQPKLKEASRQAVHTAQAIFPELKQYGEIE